ncbi:MAG: hypothetical protein HFJ41_01995 [Clostridia bacterium]|nr:hypothetical protein [Clostridia bacterium]
MTFKRELRKFRRNSKKKKKDKVKRTKYEKFLISEFIKQRIRKKASEGEKSVVFPIVGHEVIRNPKNNNNWIYIEKSDYIAFAIKNCLRYELKQDWYYKVPNKIIIFF